MNPLFQKRALEALNQMYNDPDRAQSGMWHSDPDYTTQNGKLMGKGTEVEEGALNVTAQEVTDPDTGDNLVEEMPTIEKGTFFKEGDPNKQYQDDVWRDILQSHGYTPSSLSGMESWTYPEWPDTQIVVHADEAGPFWMMLDEGEIEVWSRNTEDLADMLQIMDDPNPTSEPVVHEKTYNPTDDEKKWLKDIGIKASLKKKAAVGGDFDKRFKELADDPNSKYERACYLIADDDELWNMVADYVSVPDAPIEKLAPIIKTIPAFVPNQWTQGKCLYRGEPGYYGEYNEKYHNEGIPTWTGSHREVTSWSSNWDTAKYFAENRGFVWQTVGKIKGVALADICTARNRLRPKESNYCGMQAEWFVLSNAIKAKEATPTEEQRKLYSQRYSSQSDVTVTKSGAIRPSPSDLFRDKVDQATGIVRPDTEGQVLRPDEDVEKQADASEEEEGNVPDTGEYDFEHEAHVRQEAKDWAQYAEESDNTDTIKPFDPSGNYLCGTCDMRRGTDECARVNGPISFTTGSCRLYHLGDPETDAPMKHKFTKEDAKYTERPHVKGFGCHRCEYGSEAQGEDPEGRKSWCSFWGMHVVPNACCAENEGDDDTMFTEAGGNIDVPVEALKGEPEKAEPKESSMATYAKTFHRELKKALGQDDGSEGYLGVKHAEHHHERIVCKNCHSVQTCRCSAPKTTVEVDSCANCEGKFKKISDPPHEKESAITKTYGTGVPIGGDINAIDILQGEEDEEGTTASSHLGSLLRALRTADTLDKRAVVPPAESIEFHETPKFLPQRDDMRRHIDQNVQDEVMEGVNPAQPAQPQQKPSNGQIDPNLNPSGEADSLESSLLTMTSVAGKTADLGEEMRMDEQDEHFMDQVRDVQKEAKAAFMEDKFMLQQAQDAGIGMEQLWDELGEEYTNEWFEGTQHRVGSKCGNCNNTQGKKVAAVAGMLECTRCGSFF